MNKKFVVVTTDSTKRGVFGGYLVEYDKGQKTAILENAQMAVHWSNKTNGVVGLAAIGPQKGSRISPACPRIELDGVTAVMDCTEEARKLWQAQPWD